MKFRSEERIVWVRELAELPYCRESSGGCERKRKGGRKRDSERWRERRRKTFEALIGKKKESITVTRRDDDAEKGRGGVWRGGGGNSLDGGPLEATMELFQQKAGASIDLLFASFYPPPPSPPDEIYSFHVCISPFPPLQPPMHAERKRRRRRNSARANTCALLSSEIGARVKPTNGILFKVCPSLSWMLCYVDRAWRWITRMKDMCRR